MRSTLIVLAVTITSLCNQVLSAQNLLGTPRMTIARELKIDGVTEDLVSIGWVVVRSDGFMALQQNQDKTVVFYDAAGKRVAKFGRAGQGPGEFQSLARAGYKHDTLWVYDLMSRRTTFISPSGTLAGEIPNRGIKPQSADAGKFPTASSATTFAAFPDGSILVRAGVNPQTAVPGFTTDVSYWFQVGSDGVIRKSLGRSQDGTNWVSTTIGRGGAGSRLPFLADPIDTMSFDGQRRLAINVEISGTNANTFALFVMNAQGDTLVRRQYPFQPVPLARARLDSAYAAMATMGSRPTPPEHLANVRAKRVDTSVLPPTYEAFLGLDYSVWIRVRSTDQGDPTWLVLDPAGNPTGHLRLPMGIRVKAASLQKLWVTEADADGVQSVVRYRVSR